MKPDYSMLELRERFERATLCIAIGMAFALLSLMVGARTAGEKKFIA